MERTCVAPNCRNKLNSNSNIILHVFPRNKTMKQKWIKAIRIENFIPTKYSAVCSKHFEQKCFLKNKKHRLLRKDAVPTIFHDVNNKYMRNKLQNQSSMNEGITPSAIENESTEPGDPMRCGMVRDYLTTNIQEDRRVLKQLKNMFKDMCTRPSPLEGVSLPASPTQSSSSVSSTETEEEQDFLNEYLDNIIFVDKAEDNWTTARKYISKQGKQIAYLEQRNHYLSTKINKLKTSLRVLKQKYENIRVTVVLNNNY